MLPSWTAESLKPTDIGTEHSWFDPRSYWAFLVFEPFRHCIPADADSISSNPPSSVPL